MTAKLADGRILYRADLEALAAGAAALGVAASELTDEQVRDIVLDDRDRRRDLNYPCTEHQGCVVNTWSDEDDFDAPDNRWHHIRIGESAWFQVEVEKGGTQPWDMDIYIPETENHTAEQARELAAALIVAAARVDEMNGAKP